MTDCTAEIKAAKASAFTEAAEHLEKLADLADGSHAAIIATTLLPAAYAFRVRADRELAS